VTLTENKHFDPENLFETVEREGVTNMAIVGDAFGKPMLAYLDANPGKHKLDSVVGIISSGVMWSTEVKRGLLRHMPNAALTDSFGASEAVGFGSSVMTADGEVKTSKFDHRLEVQSVHRGRPRSRAGQRRGRLHRPRRRCAARLLQGSGEVRKDVQDDQRRAVLGAW
jgi:acyl-coenzyme A synthetase/AMP-(fatty) acid ligase